MYVNRFLIILVASCSSSTVYPALHSTRACNSEIDVFSGFTEATLTSHEWIRFIDGTRCHQLMSEISHDVDPFTPFCTVSPVGFSSLAEDVHLPFRRSSHLFSRFSSHIPSRLPSPLPLLLSAPFSQSMLH